MVTVKARRAFLHAVRRRPASEAHDPPPAFWGRVGSYDAVTRHGMLFLLSPESGHPSRRVTNRA